MTTLILKILFGCFMAFVALEAVIFGIFCLPVLMLHWLSVSLGLCSKEEIDEDLFKL